MAKNKLDLYRTDPKIIASFQKKLTDAERKLLNRKFDEARIARMFPK